MRDRGLYQGILGIEKPWKVVGVELGLDAEDSVLQAKVPSEDMEVGRL